MTHDLTLSNANMSCGIKEFAAGDVAYYMTLAKIPPGSLFAVVVHVQPANGKAAFVRVYFLTVNNPVGYYGSTDFGPASVPTIFSGL